MTDSLTQSEKEAIRDQHRLGWSAVYDYLRRQFIHTMRFEALTTAIGYAADLGNGPRKSALRYLRKRVSVGMLLEHGRVNAESVPEMEKWVVEVESLLSRNDHRGLMNKVTGEGDATV